MGDEDVIELDEAVEPPVYVPPRFESLEGEPPPWSVPPPGGFAALKRQLFHGESEPANVDQ